MDGLDKYTSVWRTRLGWRWLPRSSKPGARKKRCAKLVSQCGRRRRERRKGSFCSCHFCEIGNISATMQSSRLKFRREESCAAMTWQWMWGWQLTHLFIALNFFNNTHGCRWDGEDVWHIGGALSTLLTTLNMTELSCPSAPSVKWSCEIFRKLKAPARLTVWVIARDKANRSATATAAYLGILSQPICIQRTGQVHGSEPVTWAGPKCIVTWTRCQQYLI